ncbi:hypothetical protein D9613_001527 [Agrocybe pediades]|uniref:Survival Motor Neuron Gemin2-binding domain-containing protein n=1 Tax=Agrocybe pediades TaxID=84607 RepID=A0A8H4R5M4_9AGAR|nr:hypothetical protein D9613_001527 [Agrocybe pediades]KAF9554784.1 hypothetical protein CPC08DRAFT_712653 [Agrocybe pediades]
MSTRQIISYDDITLPYDPPEETGSTPAATTGTAPAPSNSSGTNHQPPSKKRKKNHNKNKNKQLRAESANRSNNNKNVPQQQYLMEAEEYEYAEGDYEEEESRELTHEEIWDDSALVDAWDAAMEEYQAYHGIDEDWKREPVKKSALWYNVPIDPSKSKASQMAAANSQSGPSMNIPPENVNEEEADSKPLDFNTFVPTYNPHLEPSTPEAEDQAQSQINRGTTTTGHHHVPLPAAAHYDYTADLTSVTGQMVSQDEAFQRALSAMYWGGYWTAMYHAQRHISQTSRSSTIAAAGGDGVATAPSREGPMQTDDDGYEADAQEASEALELVTQEDADVVDNIEIDADDMEADEESENEEEEDGAFVSTQR